MRLKIVLCQRKNYDKDKEWLVYAEEADLLNVALFKCTAKDWREANPDNVKKGLNIRDFASINELVVLANLENLNSILICNKIDKEQKKFKAVAITLWFCRYYTSDLVHIFFKFDK